MLILIIAFCFYYYMYIIYLCIYYYYQLFNSIKIFLLFFIFSLILNLWRLHERWKLFLGKLDLSPFILFSNYQVQIRIYKGYTLSVCQIVQSLFLLYLHLAPSTPSFYFLFNSVFFFLIFLMYLIWWRTFSIALLSFFYGFYFAISFLFKCINILMAKTFENWGQRVTQLLIEWIVW